MNKRHTKGRKCSLRPKNTWERGLEWLRRVLVGEETKTIERDRGEIRKNRADPLYRNPNFSMNREVSRIKIARNSYRGAIERCPQQKGLDGSRSYRAPIEHIEISSMDQVVVEKLSRLNLKNLDGSSLR